MRMRLTETHSSDMHFLHRSIHTCHTHQREMLNYMRDP